MKAHIVLWQTEGGWTPPSSVTPSAETALVLYFAAPTVIDQARPWDELSRRYPGARIVGCSTGGEIVNGEVQDDSVVAVALSFENAHIAVAEAHAGEDSEAIGQALARALPSDGLKGVLILSDGTQVNGSALVRGLRAALPAALPITGGLAGDGAAFQHTRVGLDRAPESGAIVAIGFYGAALTISHGSFGGWDPFGPARLVTRSAGNILYELDGEPALDLYRRYLGEEADQLPGSALLYPLRIRQTARSETDVVRTVVGIDGEQKAMIFAGDIPQGCTAQLMRGNFDRLIAGAETAAEQACRRANGEATPAPLANPAQEAGTDKTAVAILISCIGRKLLLGPRIDQEAEAVANTLPPDTANIGFYSYGEIAPHGFTGTCELHNQTMTITLIREG